MRRIALLVLGVLALTWLEFKYYPGHSYLRGQSQIYVPVLERLDAPGYLSRDLVAAHPDVAYTIYDEVTLFLHEVGRLKFQTALEGQQFLCRAAAMTGVLLLALSAGIGDLLAFVIAALVNLGALVVGPAILLIDPEPVPRAFAFALILLAAGLIASEKPLLAGLAGGTALIYSPIIAAPYWGVLLLALLLDRKLRRLLRPALTILIIFVLLLANLAQLQPGVVESAGMLHKLPATVAAVEQFRTPTVWVSRWAPGDLWSNLAIYVCGVWALARIWSSVNRPLRWLLGTLPLVGILSVPLVYVMLEKLRWSAIPEIKPTQALLFTIAFSGIACGIAGARGAMARRPLEAALWFCIVIALPINSRILDLLRISERTGLSQLAVTLTLAIVLTGLLIGEYRWRAASLLVPVLAIWIVPRVGSTGIVAEDDWQSTIELAAWAETGTWGSSMFLFPDAGRALYPGTFRAASRRAVWVDWTSGALVDGFESVAEEWGRRWRETMQGQFSAERLQDMLSLPIDYYVLKRNDRLATVRPVFLNREFVVYDAADLRRAIYPLRLAINRGST